MSIDRTHLASLALIGLLSLVSAEAFAAGEKEEATKYYREGKHAADLAEDVQASNLPEAAMALYISAIGKLQNAEKLFAACAETVCANKRHEVQVELAGVYLLAHRLYRQQHGPDSNDPMPSPVPAESSNLTPEDCANLLSRESRDDCELLYHAKTLYEGFRDARPAVTASLLAVVQSELPKIYAELGGYTAQIEQIKAKAAAEAKARAEDEAREREEKAELQAQAERNEQERALAVERLQEAEAKERAQLAKRTKRQMWTGIGLTIGGGGIALIGMGVSLPFATAPQGAINNPTWPDTPIESVELERNRAYMRKPYYAAWVTGAVGGAVLLSGVALIVTTVVIQKRKKSAENPSARLRPSLGGLEVRF